MGRRDLARHSDTAKDDSKARASDTTTMARPGIYETLRDRPEGGTLCELPLGIVDGFGGTGQLDSRTLFYQTIHGRPMVGGFVARLPPAVVNLVVAGATMVLRRRAR